MKNRLMALLLEIYEKEIYKEQGCTTIYEYGFKFAKLSRETVQLALRTLRNTEDKPLLRAKIATQGVYKVAMVAKLATPETDKIFAEHVEMPKETLFEYAKELRNGKCVATKVTIELDEETQILFNQLKKKLAANTSNTEALKIILKSIPGNVSPKPGKTAQTRDERLPARTPSNQKKREVYKKTNGKCAYTACTKPIENYHHTVPFAFSHSHDSLIGLCKTHHEFCHQGLVLNELQKPENWELSLKPHKSLYDNLYLKYKPRLA